MEATIIFAHPWHGSFNKAIMDKVIEGLKNRNKKYNIIDLNKDNFNPALDEKNLSLYAQGLHDDEHVSKYQEMIAKSDELIFIFPVWWFDVPAILKGFIDKVMLKDYAFIEEKTGLKGLLSNIKNTVVISTSEAATWYIKYLAGDAINKTFIKATLKGIGLKNVKWINHDYTTSGPKHEKELFLDDVEGLFSSEEVVKKGKKMKFTNFLKAISVLTLGFGFGFFLIPDMILTLLGMNLDASGLMIAKMFGASYILTGILFLMLSSIKDIRVMKAIAVSIVIGDGLVAILSIQGQLNNMMNVLGWGNVLVTLGATLISLYYLLARKNDNWII